MEFKLDLKPLKHVIDKAPDEVGKIAKQSLGDIKDKWVRGSVDVAPLDSGNLRRQIHGEIEGEGLKSQIIVTANANESRNGDTFNYAYYIHEGHMADDGKHLKHAGTVEKFLEEPVDEKKWQETLEKDLESRLKEMGW